MLNENMSKKLNLSNKISRTYRVVLIQYKNPIENLKTPRTINLVRGVVMSCNLFYLSLYKGN